MVAKFILGYPKLLNVQISRVFLISLGRCIPSFTTVEKQAFHNKPLFERYLIEKQLQNAMLLIVRWSQERRKCKNCFGRMQISFWSYWQSPRQSQAFKRVFFAVLRNHGVCLLLFCCRTRDVNCPHLTHYTTVYSNEVPLILIGDALRTWNRKGSRLYKSIKMGNASLFQKLSRIKLVRVSFL